MMIDFGELSAQRAQQKRQQAPAVVTQQVAVSTTTSAEASYLLKQADQWTWEDLRNYIVTEYQKRFGAMIRNPAKEAGILKAFIGRHGIADAVLTAKAAFEIYEGTWRSAPIGIERFTKNNDPYFAEVILARVKG
jgi:hypothetical protein